MIKLLVIVLAAASGSLAAAKLGNPEGRFARPRNAVSHRCYCRI